MKKALFWDFDGTLSYPNKSFFTALDTALLNSGYNIEKSETQGFLKNVYSWKAPEKSYPDKCNELWWEILFGEIEKFCISKNIEKNEVEKICIDFKKTLTDVSNYKLYDDTKQTLEKCIELGYKNYLITNNYPEIVENLVKLGISKYFADFVISSHIGYEKPRSEFFDYAKKTADNPDVGYVIGDNPVADIQGGKEAGYKTIAVHECKESSADYYLQNLCEIITILA